jgi:hypothetical protein
MSNKISISFLFCSVFLILCCNNSNTTCENLAKGDVCIVVKNRSGKLIKSVELKHSKKRYKIENLENNQNANISYNSPSESSYQIAVIFEDGRVIKSNGSYTEGGYTVTEIIHENKIETKFGKTY